MFKLRKTRPPFATQRSDSFSSGEEDDFDDDGFREMTADNLFSTLLTRVKSLTRRIHDDHEDQLSRAASSSFHQNHGIINHRLNPGNTHARLERTALRNSLKRNNSNTPVTAASLSRQSSMDTSMRTSLRDYDGVSSTLAGFDDGTSSIRSYSSFGGGGGGSDALGGGSRTSATSSTINQQRGISTNDTNSILQLDSKYESGGVNQHQQQLQQQNNQGKEESKRYIDLEIGNSTSTTTTTMSAAPSSGGGSKSTTDQQQQQPLSSSSGLSSNSNDPSSNLQSNVSVTSKQRLRPGYLPPPSHLASDQSATDSTSHDTRIEHALSQSSSLNKHLDRMQIPQQQQSSTTASSSSNTASVTSVMTSVSKPSTSTTRQIPINLESDNADYSKNVTTSVANATKTTTTTQNDDVMETLSQKSGYSNRSSARPSSSSLVPPPQKEPRRQSRYLQDVDDHVPLSTKPYLQIGKPTVGSSSSSIKRLSGNFDLDQDNDNSSSSGYYSSQPHHQRQQQLPIQQHVHQHQQQNPPTSSTRSLEGQLTKPSLMFVDKESKPSSSVVTTSIASFTASNSSSIISNPTSTSGPPPALSATITTSPTSSTNVVVPSNLSSPQPSSVTKMPMPPSQLPSMSHIIASSPMPVVSSSSIGINAGHRLNNTTATNVVPITSSRLQQAPLSPTTVTLPTTSTTASSFFPSTPVNTPTVMSLSSAKPIASTLSSSYPPVLSAPSSPPMSPPPILRSGPTPTSPTSKSVKLVETPTQRLLAEQEFEKSISQQSAPKITQPIYSPFKKPELSLESSNKHMAVAALKEDNPFQKKVRSQPYRPYLQLALEKDRIHKLQTKKDTDDAGDNSKAGTVGRRTILPYGGAKSDGLLNKHAFISSNVIAAAERRKRDSYSRSSTTELLPMEKVTRSQIS